LLQVGYFLELEAVHCSTTLQQIDRIAREEPIVAFINLAGNKNRATMVANRRREEALLLAATLGHEWAFVELCEGASRHVFRTVHRIMRCREDAEDVCQDALMRAFIHLRRFKHDCSFQTWITRIAINSALTVLRQRSTRHEVPVDAPDSEDGAWRQLEIVDGACSPEERYERCEERARLRSAIMQLPKPCREVIEIRHAADASMEEIAQIAGISVAATKSRLLRARITLRRELTLNGSILQDRVT
jgi:RNA polymerase sigma factor (sigma-70 family)